MVTCDYQVSLVFIRPSFFYSQLLLQRERGGEKGIKEEKKRERHGLGREQDRGGNVARRRETLEARADLHFKYTSVAPLNFYIRRESKGRTGSV